MPVPINRRNFTLGCDWLPPDASICSTSSQLHAPKRSHEHSTLKASGRVFPRVMVTCKHHISGTVFQQLSTNGWENVSVLLSQPGESTILFQPGRSDKNFSREGRFCLAKKEGLKKKCSGAHSGRRKIIKFPGKAEARNLEQGSIMFTSSIMLYAVSCIPGGKFPQNRYFEERSLVCSRRSGHTPPKPVVGGGMVGAGATEVWVCYPV